MTESSQTFYYSRNKIGLYLLFNIGLMALALIFTWSVYPDYKLIYYFALITCSLSIINCIFVYLMHLPAVEISKKGIKIDQNQPLRWDQVKSVKKKEYAHLGLKKYFLKIEAQKIGDYKFRLMQQIAKHSRFGAFSVPLYAMEDADAKKAEKLIKEYTATSTVSTPAAKTPAEEKKKQAPARKVQTKTKATTNKTKPTKKAPLKAKKQSTKKTSEKSKTTPIKKTTKTKKTSNKKGA